MLSSQRRENDPIPIKSVKAEPNFHGASIVLDSGIEIPITEAMIQTCLKQILKEQAKSKTIYLA